MRKIVEVIGVGKRKQGLSKKGRKYDFTELSIAYEDENTVGRMAETIPFDTAIIGDRVITPGEVLDIVFHRANFKTYVDAIL